MIEVRITAMGMLDAKLPDLVIAHKLKEAGIPIKGTLANFALLRGTIRKRTDAVSDTIIYRWTE